MIMNCYLSLLMYTKISFLGKVADFWQKDDRIFSF